ncbi:hypothetical protein, partial [Bacillus cereus group sp. BC329]
MKAMLSQPYPLGATLDNDGCNFAVFAPANKDIVLALFHVDGSYQTHPLDHEYAGIQHTYVEGVKAGQRYGFITQVEGE